MRLKESTIKKFLERLRLTEEEFEEEAGFKVNQLTDALLQYLIKMT